MNKVIALIAALGGALLLCAVAPKLTRAESLSSVCALKPALCRVGVICKARPGARGYSCAKVQP